MLGLTRILVGTVVNVGPIMSDMPWIGQSRPVKVSPNTTSSELPEYIPTTSAHAARIVEGRVILLPASLETLATCDAKPVA